MVEAATTYIVAADWADAERAWKHVRGRKYNDLLDAKRLCWAMPASCKRLLEGVEIPAGKDIVVTAMAEGLLDAETMAFLESRLRGGRILMLGARPFEPTFLEPAEELKKELAQMNAKRDAILAEKRIDVKAHEEALADKIVAKIQEMTFSNTSAEKIDLDPITHQALLMRWEAFDFIKCEVHTSCPRCFTLTRSHLRQLFSAITCGAGCGLTAPIAYSERAAVDYNTFLENDTSQVFRESGEWRRAPLHEEAMKELDEFPLSEGGEWTTGASQWADTMTSWTRGLTCHKCGGTVFDEITLWPSGEPRARCMQCGDLFRAKSEGHCKNRGAGGVPEFVLRPGDIKGALVGDKLMYFAKDGDLSPHPVAVAQKSVGACDTDFKYKDQAVAHERMQAELRRLGREREWPGFLDILRYAGVRLVTDDLFVSLKEFPAEVDIPIGNSVPCLACQAPIDVGCELRFNGEDLNACVKLTYRELDYRERWKSMQDETVEELTDKLCAKVASEIARDVAAGDFVQDGSRYRRIEEQENGPRHKQHETYRQGSALK